MYKINVLNQTEIFLLVRFNANFFSFPSLPSALKGAVTAHP